MNEKETKQQLNEPSEAIEDLTVNEAEAEEVKGGIFNAYLQIRDVDGESTDARPNPYVTTDYDVVANKKI
jgi:hypothetical protein